MLAIQILLWTGLGVLGGRIAARKGYPPAAGVLVGVFTGPLGLILSVLIPPTLRASEQAAWEEQTARDVLETAKTQACPQCGRENSVATRVCPRCEHRFG